MLARSINNAAQAVFRANYSPDKLRIKMRITALVASALLAACTTTSDAGRPFLEGAVDNLKTGSTTTTQVAQLLGEPFAKHAHANGNETWIYTYTHSSKTGAPGLYDRWVSGTETVRSRTLTISFAKDKISDCTLSSYDFDGTGTLLERGATGGKTHREEKCGQG
jgi:outer membrane protein assembly factor BamE (lipoprotein component of BamABCDE complex)